MSLQRAERRKARRERSGGGAAGRQGWARVMLVVAAGAVLILAAAYVVATRGAEPVSGARQMADQGVSHVAAGQPHPPYNSVPPTSGWHYEKPAPWGIHDRPIDDETQVHNLEHGGIMIQYRCPQGCPDLVQRLTQLVRRYPSKVILAPYAREMPNRVALTAWTWIDTFDDFDERRIVAFIEAHINRGPEKVPD